MPFLMSASFFERPSRRAWSAFSSSLHFVEALSESRLAARRFMAMKVLVPPTTVCAAAAAASSSPRAAVACSSGRSPSMRNGASASETLRTLSSASFTRPSDSATMPLTTFCSARARMAARDWSSWSWTSLMRARSFMSSSFAAFWERDCVSTYRHTDLSVTWHSLAAVSAAFAASSPASSPSSAATIAPTFLTDSSAAAILAFDSSTTRLAAKRCSHVEASFRHLVTSVCAELILVWYLMSSALTSTDASLPLDSICLWVRNFLASVIAAMAMWSAFCVSSAAPRRSAAVASQSLLSSSKMAAASAMRFVRSSASAT
mmetsp:Transcript_112809/g.329648  ORF Transcript_112809/g.329648 Transcript_112809/m.329648 type:complete len:318 (+) Transcript_112809:2398-3351(+)